MPLSFSTELKKNKQTKNNAPHQVQGCGSSVTEKKEGDTRY